MIEPGTAGPALLTLALAAALVALLVVTRRHKAARAELRRSREESAELQRQEGRARAAAELHQRLVAQVSHELRTPMQAIMGLLALLEDDAIAPDQRRRHLATLRGASEDLLLLIDGLLDTAQVEGQQPPLRADDFSPRAVLEQVVHLLGPSANQRGVALRCELAPDLPPTLRGDRLRLRQVVINLLGNAIKYAGRGHVELRARARVSDGVARLRVDVVDDGPGVSARARAALFRPFARGEGGGAAVEGTGLGLVISKQLVESMGGCLELDSDPGVGSTFWFEIALPIVAQTAAPASSAPADTVDARPRVLVADDDHASRELLSAALRRSGYVVDGVADGAAAVASATTRPYVAAVLDVQLPELDGPAAARQIRAVRGDIALIALTGHTEVDVLGRCREAGIDAVLIKPVGLESLRATIARTSAERACAVDLSVIRGYVTADDPAFVPGLIDVYLREAGRDLQEMSDASARGDGERVAQLAHRLKGSSAGFGARLLAERCQSLYAAARAGMPIAAEMTAVTREFARVHEALAAEQARLKSA